MRDNDFLTWYNSLNKPSWTPSPETIGTAWTILYPIIIIVNFIVIKMLINKQISFIVALPFLINLLANLIFTPIQFGLRNLDLALLDILIILITIIWSMLAIWPHKKVLALAFIPYLIWVVIASSLQAYITFKN